MYDFNVYIVKTGTTFTNLEDIDDGKLILIGKRSESMISNSVYEIILKKNITGFVGSGLLIRKNTNLDSFEKKIDGHLEFCGVKISGEFCKCISIV